MKMERLRRFPSASSRSTDSRQKRPSLPSRKTNISDSREDKEEEQRIVLTPHNDKIISSLLTLPVISDVDEAPTKLSPDSFVGASQDTDFRRLRDNTRRIRNVPSGSEPKDIDVAYGVYKKLKEESVEICRKLLRHSQNTGRHESLEAEIASVETQSSHDSSVTESSLVTENGSVTETSLPFKVNDQWLSAIHEYKSVQESLLENHRISLLETYKSYEPDAPDHQIQAFFTDKILRANLIAMMRDTSVQRTRSERPEFWQNYIIRFMNYDRLKIELETIEELFDIAASGTAPNMTIKEYAIAQNGDTILEFANVASEIHPILRFRVSSHLLAEVSPLFSQMFSSSRSDSHVPLDTLSGFLPPPPTRSIFKDGTEVKVYKMPQIELNHHESLTILLHAAHMHHRKVPREIDFPVFVSIAEVCLRYQCTSPLELQVEYQWLPQWVHMAGAPNPDGFLLISYTFGLRRIFTRMSKTAILNAVDEEDIQSKELWPQVIRDKIKAIRAAKLAQIHECCTNAIQGYFRRPLDQNTYLRASIGSLVFTTVPRCPKGSHLCDATNLGWLMLVYNELCMLPSIVKSVDFRDLPNLPRRSLKELCDCLRLMPSAPQVHTGICDYAPAFRSAINDISNSISGLSLRDVSGRNGWALSKHKDPTDDQHEPPPRERPHESPIVMYPKRELVSMPDKVALRILLHMDNLDDLQSTAMINKGFYVAYQRNEIELLRNIARADRSRSRGMSQSALKSNNDIYGGTPLVSPLQETLITPAETLKILCSYEETNSTMHTNIESSVERNEKYLVGEMVPAENKARLTTENKHLREEQDNELRGRGNGVDS